MRIRSIRGGACVYIRVCEYGFLYHQRRMNGGIIVLLERDHDLLCEREPVGDSRQWNDTVKLSLIGSQMHYVDQQR